jgi:phosphotriesterase-related protein
VILRTVLGDVAPDRLGAVYMHEHVIIDSPFVAEELPDILLPSVEEAVAELGPCATAGVSAMVDAMPLGAGRSVARLAEVSRRSGVAIVATTGLHTSRFYRDQPWALEATPEELSSLFIADIEEGIDHHDLGEPGAERTEHRAGLIKVATLGGDLDDRDRRLFAAAAMASAKTGAPILTHCEDGEGGLEQITQLSELGVALHRVVLSHTDKAADAGYHRDLLATGVNLEYDQSLRLPPTAENTTVRLLVEMVEAGFIDQLMLGTDGARRSLWASLGGAPGLAWLATGFIDLIREAGITEEQVRTLFETNPQRFLTLEEPT